VTRRRASFHAVQRYRQRWRPDLSLNEAWHELERHASDARLVGLTQDGCEVVQTRRGAVCIVARDGTIKTVLAPGQRVTA